VFNKKKKGGSSHKNRTINDTKVDNSHKAFWQYT